jgi:hypothetical protein
MYHVLVSANSRAETIEELEAHRKRVVVQVLDTLHADVCRAVDAAVKTAAFETRVAQDRTIHYKDDFVRSIKDESAAHMAVCKALGIRAYWVNRRGETADPQWYPFTEVRDVAEAARSILA